MSIVYHGNFFIDNEFRDRYVTVDDKGKIISITTETSETDVAHIEGKIIPSGVDIHVHFREPGEEYKEDFRSGSISAIFGGTTFVADMPNNKHPILTHIDFIEKLKSISNRSYVDFSLYQAGSNEIIDDALGEKIFLGKSTGGLLTDLKSSLFSNKIKVVHAELQRCLDNNTGKDRSLVEHDLTRPVECEFAAIEEVFKSGLTNVHIAHLTSIRSIILSKNFGFTTEVTPHHLLLNSEMNIGPYGKVNPPLRKKNIQQEILQNLNSRMIDMISSDHAPHSLEEKDDFERAPSGMPGVETRLPLVLSLVKNRQLTLGRAVELLSTNPARRIGINKGVIATGFDADFISVNLKEDVPIKGQEMHTKAKWTPFEGFRGVFPSAVYLRGKIVMENGQIEPRSEGVFVNGKQQGKGNS